MRVCLSPPPPRNIQQQPPPLSERQVSRRCALVRFWSTEDVVRWARLSGDEESDSDT